MKVDKVIFYQYEINIKEKLNYLIDVQLNMENKKSQIPTEPGLTTFNY